MARAVCGACAAMITGGASEEEQKRGHEVRSWLVRTAVHALR